MSTYLYITGKNMRHKIFILCTKADFSLACLREKYEHFMPHIFPVIYKMYS